MLVAFLIMLREGIEAALIVGIVAGYLRQTGRARWLPAVWGGVAFAVVVCVALGVGLDLASAEFPQREQEMFEGGVAVIAAAILTSMVFWMRRAARSLKASLHADIERAIGADTGGGLALVGMVVLAVGREGLESVFFLLATFEQSTGPAVPLGAVLGLLCATGVGAAIYLGGVRLNLRRFFHWTSLFIVFVAAGLLAGAVRAFHEAGLWNGLQSVVFDASGVLPADGPLGTVLVGLLGYNDAPTLGEVVAYLAYLIPATLLFAAPPRAVAGPRPIPSKT
jgi:high-affinity iron transporter